MNEVFVIRSTIAAFAILAGSCLIGIGAGKETACVVGGVALLFYSFGVMLSLPSTSKKDE